jgi:hypothetical protein
MWNKIHLIIRRAELHEALNNLDLLEFGDSQSSSLRNKKECRR